MHIAFDGLIGLIILIYLDDLTIFPKQGSNHFAHLSFVCVRCWKYGVSLNPSKSIFGVETEDLLGHIDSSSRFGIEPDRVEAIQNLSLPKSKKDIQAFMGKINFVRRFVPDFSKIVKSIHKMLKN